MNNLQPQRLLNVNNQLGEGPIWDPDQGMLFWLDIRKNQLHGYDPDTALHQLNSLDSQVTALGLIGDGGLIAATDRGITYWRKKTGLSESIVHPLKGDLTSRFNDGAVDPAGRFWVGTMTTVGDNRSIHALYRLDGDLTMHKIMGDVILSNGMGWSPNGKTMYYVDSLRHCIFAFDYDSTSGAIANRRVFAQVPESEGVPDGMTVDVDGCIWSAIWGGWKVIRFDPAGRQMLALNLPVAHVTSCAFGGHDLSTLYITTAWIGLREAARQTQPLAGDLFCIETDTKGQAPKFFMSQTKP